MEVGSVNLLTRTRAAGLSVCLDAAGAVIVRGPKRLAGLAEEVLEHAAAVREALSPDAAQPTDPCLACSTVSWFLAADWPTRGTSTRLCRSCSTRPSPSLSELAATLTPDHHARLDAEAAADEAVADLAVAVTRALAADGPGWVAMGSRALAEAVVFTRDRDVRVPEEYVALPRFDRDELAILAARRPSVDRLRAIVDVKREMPGTRMVVGDAEGERA